MDKRFQVFVSSTYVDLQVERQEVIQALLELDCIPAGMELFPAADEDQWTLIKKVIDDCDYYIVIVGGRYGSLAPSGISYTQMEYEYAVTSGKPVIGFVHKDPGAIPASKTEQSEEGKSKLEAFREIVQRKMCKHWSTPAELGSMVSRSLVKLIKNHPAIGWVRADLVPDEAASKEILKLRKRIEELEVMLESTRTEAPRGTEALSQGDDPFPIDYTYSVRNQLYQTATYEDSMETTWNEIFATLGPHMIDEESEFSLRMALNDWIEVNELPLLEDNFNDKDQISNFEIAEDDFQTIKVQLRALGLITKSKRPRSVKDTSTYWALTPYGDNVMTKLRAIKKADLNEDEVELTLEENNDVEAAT